MHTFKDYYKNKISWVLVAHTCNPSYSGGRDHKDYGLKSAWANNFEILSYLEKTHHRKGLVE
jgi:hypothetical protein